MPSILRKCTLHVAPFLYFEQEAIFNTDQNFQSRLNLTLKAPITIAADDKFWDIFPNFQQK